MVKTALVCAAWISVTNSIFLNPFRDQSFIAWLLCEQLGSETVTLLCSARKIRDHRIVQTDLLASSLGKVKQVYKKELQTKTIPEWPEWYIVLTDCLILAVLANFKPNQRRTRADHIRKPLNLRMVWFIAKIYTWYISHNLSVISIRSRSACKSVKCVVVSSQQLTTVAEIGANC